MNAPATPQGQDRTSALFYSVLGSLIATALLAAGPWLAARQVPDETVLQFSYTDNRVSDISAWYIRITNASEVAFDVQINPPNSILVRHRYSPAIDAAPTWRGQIPKGQFVDILYVLEDVSARLSPAVVQSLVTASYQDRNPQTGAVETRAGTLREIGAIPFARTALLVFWFLLPMILMITLFFIPKLFKWVKVWLGR